MPDCQKLAFMKRLTAHLEGINPTQTEPATEDAYAFDLREHVYRGRVTFAQDEVTSAILSIVESPKPIEPVAVGSKSTRKSSWVLLVQGTMPEDKKSNGPSDQLYNLMAVVQSRMFMIAEVNEATGDPMYPDVAKLLDGNFDSLAIGEGIVRPSDPQISPYAFFYVPVTVGIVTDLRNPYAA
jgi:hypothetical protein